MESGEEKALREIGELEKRLEDRLDKVRQEARDRLSRVREGAAALIREKEEQVTSLRLSIDKSREGFSFPTEEKGEPFQPTPLLQETIEKMARKLVRKVTE